MGKSYVKLVGNFTYELPIIFFDRLNKDFLNLYPELSFRFRFTKPQSTSIIDFYTQLRVLQTYYMYHCHIISYLMHIKNNLFLFKYYTILIFLHSIQLVMQFSSGESSVINTTNIYILKFCHKKDTVKFSVYGNLLMNVC